jgi:hypothetical protein
MCILQATDAPKSDGEPSYWVLAHHAGSSDCDESVTLSQLGWSMWWADRSAAVHGGVPIPMPRGVRPPAVSTQHF